MPIRWGGRVVSFQTRDVTGRSRIKYMACPPGREAVSHKDVVYGRESGWRRAVGLGVEGVTDVWRLGPRSFATFGVQVRPRQLIRIARRFDRVVLVFDPDPAAQARARALAPRLRAVGTRVAIENPGDTDPGDMSDDDARHLVRQLTTEYH